MNIPTTIVTIGRYRDIADANGANTKPNVPNNKINPTVIPDAKRSPPTNACDFERPSFAAAIMPM